MTQQKTDITAATRNNFGDAEGSNDGVAEATTSLWYRILFWGGLAVGAALLLLFPLAKPLWTDEVLNLQSGSYSIGDILQGRGTPRDHTPLQAFALWAIRSVFGDNLAFYRFFSALPAVITPYITYLLGRRISPKVGLLALWITALAPGIVLFDRMARYHGMLGLLATWSVYLFLRALGTGKKQFIVGYTLVTLSMLLIYVPSLFLVVGQFCSLAYHWRRERHALKIFGAMVVCAICLSPVILWQLAAQTGGGAVGNGIKISVEDPSVGQGIGGFIRRVGLPVYMYCVGETIYPWSWAVSIPGIVGSLFAFAMGTRYLIRGRDFVVPVAVVVTTVLFGAITSGKFGALQTLGSMGKRNSFLIPLFCVTVATGLMTIRSRPLRIGLIAILFGVWGYANFNYWTGREFLNPNYTAPWNAVMQRLDSEGFRENAIIITDEDVVMYTMSQGNTKVPVVSPNTPGIGGYGRVDKTLALAAKKQEDRRYIYFIGRDRGNRIAVNLGDRVCAALANQYECVYEAGFMERSESEKYWLEKMMKRPTPPYYIWVKRFDTQTPASGVTATSNMPGESRP
ncbi:MAG: glycosyltransferase family 39 protein [Fibrella sp.]|nr:glycosyltransferase family 39 protein [Armatimonadota bacterium]